MGVVNYATVSYLCSHAATRAVHALETRTGAGVQHLVTFLCLPALLSHRDSGSARRNKSLPIYQIHDYAAFTS